MPVQPRPSITQNWGSMCKLRIDSAVSNRSEKYKWKPSGNYKWKPLGKAYDSGAALRGPAQGRERVGSVEGLVFAMGTPGCVSALSRHAQWLTAAVRR